MPKTTESSDQSTDLVCYFVEWGYAVRVRAVSLEAANMEDSFTLQIMSLTSSIRL